MWLDGIREILKGISHMRYVGSARHGSGSGINRLTMSLFER